MGLPQLVGQTCVVCQGEISSVTEGTFCPACGNPVHRDCHRPPDARGPEGGCETCGGDPTCDTAREVQAARTGGQAPWRPAPAPAPGAPAEALPGPALPAAGGVQGSSTPTMVEQEMQPAEGVAEEPALDQPMAQVLVPVLRIFAALCALGTLLVVFMVSEEASQQKRDPGPAMLAPIVTGLAITAVLLALAEVLKLVLSLHRRMRLLEDSFEEPEEETPAE